MGMIYRGYPFVWQEALQESESEAVTAYSAEKEPYMLYRREEQPDEGMDLRRIREEQEYFKGMYPLNVKKRQGVVDAACDRYDHPDSFFYDAYPDRETMLQMRDLILRDAAELGMDEEKELTYVLLLSELERRRRRN